MTERGHAAGVPAWQPPATTERPPPATVRTGRTRLERIVTALLITLPLVMTGLVFHGLLRLYFLTDDFLNLYRIVDQPLLEYLLRPHGGHLLLTRNFLFYLFHAAFGTNAPWYFAMVLATHLLNVYLLFRVVQRVTGSAYLASFGAALWGICPLHIGTLGWYSVYGQVIVCTIMLYLLGRSASLAQRGRLSAALAIPWVVLLLLAATSFGTGIAFAGVAPIVFFLILPPGRARLWICVTTAVFAVCLPILYTSALSFYASTFGGGVEVLLAQLMFGTLSEVSPDKFVDIARVLALLLRDGTADLVLGANEVARTDSLGLIVSLLALAGIAVAAFTSPLRMRRWIIASALVAIASYGIIATARTGMTTQLRYHYVATAAIALALCFALARLRFLLHPSHVRGLPLLLIWAILATYVQLVKVPPPHRGAAARLEVMSLLNLVELRAGAAPLGGEVYIRNEGFKGAGMLLYGSPNFPGLAAVFIIYYPSNEVAGRRVYFVEQDSETIAAATGRRSSTLLVSPSQAAAARAGLESDNDP